MKKNKTAATLPTADERLDWLLAFLRRDLTTLRPGERLDLDDDMARLLWLRDPAAVDPPDAPDPYAPALAKLKGEAPDLPWPDALVLEVQTKLKAGIALLEAGRRWEPFTPKPVDGRLPKPDPLLPIFTVQADKTIARRYHGSYLTIMLASAVDLLVTAWPQLRRCAYAPCSVLFRPKENRQHYHDPKCSKLKRWHRMPKTKRNYTQEEANAARREQLKKKANNKPSGKRKHP